MDYEKAYKEALERAKKLHSKTIIANLPGDKEKIEQIFPELKESEDEGIRKELIERFKWELKGAEEQDAAGCSRQKDIEMFKRGIAWLEKQSETNTEDFGEFINELSKQFPEVSFAKLSRIAVRVKKWLEKPNHWNPSEEQLEALKYAVDYFGELTEHFAEYDGIKSLYNDLKTL